MIKLKVDIGLLLWMIIFPGILRAQISPGELSMAHSKYEGMHHCTDCHNLGGTRGAANEKCLACHVEIDQLRKSGLGYHASSEVKGKQCATCHSEHHGRSFDIVRFEKEKFNHKMTSFDLVGKHETLDCEECHTEEFIKEKKSQKTKKPSYLGLSTACLACHDDYHQGTLSNQCLDCHTYEGYKPAPRFDHQKSEYPLVGAHQSVSCESCHKVTNKNGKKFQQFKNLSYSRCVDCHEDVHNNRFGNDCLKCHNINSFQDARNAGNFNHDNTGFPLIGQHKQVDCKLCHKVDFKTPLRHSRCSDCHEDYHKGQFKSEKEEPDCQTCHTNDGFSPSTYILERHNSSQFVLKGGHLATPCIECHKPADRWEFRDIGEKCLDCHANVHEGLISEKYYPEKDCSQCHNEQNWSQIQFDHAKTSFPLQGIHATNNCRDCHYRTAEGTKPQQRFSGLTSTCVTCHDDIHLGQFAKVDENNCQACHQFENWDASLFDHDKTRFKLDGEHKDLACDACHKEVTNEKGKCIQYKFEDIRCSSCHSSQP